MQEQEVHIQGTRVLNTVENVNIFINTHEFLTEQSL